MCASARLFVCACLPFALFCMVNSAIAAPRSSPKERILKKEKRLGQIFTPQYLVCEILDFAGYTISGNILGKHVIDNSCGDGAFLREVVRRYCVAYINDHGARRKKGLAKELETFVHGVEIDRASYSKCLENLDAVAREMRLPNIKWDIRNMDTMSVDCFDGAMDFVVGNPPYVRVHNLDDSFEKVKRYSFCCGGMTDLYLVFYEIGLKMLSPRGRLCYIAPSSWINSVAGWNMRECLRTRRYLRGIIDLQHYQPFNATTYTAITLLENGHDAKQFTYGVYDGPQKVRIIDELAYDDAFFDDALFLGDKNTLRQFKAMKTADVPSRVEVKNGFATLADDVFVSDEFPFDDFVIPVIKASTGKWRKGFYPYDSNGKPMLRNRIFSCAAVAEYLHSNKEALLKGRSEAKCHDWYLYGRTQALKDVWVNKYSINTVIKDVSSIKINAVPGGAGVYSGLYIVSDVPEAKLREVLECSDFIKYISVLKKYKSGGYYTFNSRELKQYLNYKLRNEKSIKAKAVQQQFHFD